MCTGFISNLALLSILTSSKKYFINYMKNKLIDYKEEPKNIAKKLQSLLVLLHVPFYKD